MANERPPAEERDDGADAATEVPGTDIFGDETQVSTRAGVNQPGIVPEAGTLPKPGPAKQNSPESDGDRT